MFFDGALSVKSLRALRVLRPLRTVRRMPRVQVLGRTLLRAVKVPCDIVAYQFTTLNLSICQPAAMEKVGCDWLRAQIKLFFPFSNFEMDN